MDSNMPLVYPIYLDTPMMMGFLASVENGVTEEYSLEEKVADAKDSSGNVSARGKLSSFVSFLLDAEVKGEIAKKISELLESNYKSTVKFPNTALFFRLYNLLKDEKIIKKIGDSNSFKDVSLGDIVEFQGTAYPSPEYQIRHLFSQIIPLFEPLYGINTTTLNQQMLELDNMKPGKNTCITVGGNKIPLQSKKQLDDLKNLIESTIQKEKYQYENFKALGDALEKMLPECSSELMIIKAMDFKTICRIYPMFARNENLQDILDCHWICVGKVIEIIDASGSYNFWKRSPLNYYAKKAFDGFFEGFNKGKSSEDPRDEAKEGMYNLEPIEPNISGPILVIAPLAIFS
jgi:hypothetical protein